MSIRIVKRPPQSSNTPLIIAILFVGLGVGAIFWIGGSLRNVEPVASDGEQLYNQYCSACHGNHGEGNTSLQAPALDSTGNIWELTDGEIQRAILTGGEIMPNHEQILTTTQAADIIRYIQTWWTDEQLAEQQVSSQQDPLQP